MSAGRTPIASDIPRGNPEASFDGVSDLKNRSARRQVNFSCFIEAGFASGMPLARAFLSTGVTSREPRGRCSFAARRAASSSCNFQPLCLDVQRGVEVTIVCGITSATDPIPVRQLQIILDPTTGGTHLRGGEESPDLHDGVPVPLRLVGQLPPEFTPPDIGDGFGEAVVLQHPRDVQGLYGKPP